MKVCITATGTDLESDVDPRFGRASHLLVIDTETGNVRRLEGATGSSHGAGVQAARSVVRAGAAALVTGRIGPRAHDVLVAAGIPAYLTPPATVAAAIREFTAGTLEPIRGAGAGHPRGGVRG